MNHIDQSDLNTLCEQAAASPRLRAHRLLHADHADAVQRVLIGLQPGTVVRPHRHDAPLLWETHVCLAGAFDLILFDDRGAVSERLSLHHEGLNRLAEVDTRRWHSLCAMRPNSVTLEFKQGPFQAVKAENFAPWAPAEDDPIAPRWEGWLRTATIGERFNDAI